MLDDLGHRAEHENEVPDDLEDAGLGKTVGDVLQRALQLQQLLGQRAHHGVEGALAAASPWMRPRFCNRMSKLAPERLRPKP